MGYDDESTEDYCIENDVITFGLSKQGSDQIQMIDGYAPGWQENEIFMMSFTGLAQDIPTEFELKSAYPNPFNPVTTIKYGLPEDGFVSLEIYDVNGRVVESLVNDNQIAGFYSIAWNATAESSGLYFIRLTSKNESHIQKIMLIK